MHSKERLPYLFKEEIENINYTLGPDKYWAFVIQIKGGQGQIELTDVNHSCVLDPRRFGNFEVQYESRFFLPKIVYLPFATTQLSTIIQDIYEHRDNDHGANDPEIDIPQYKCMFCCRKYFREEYYIQHTAEIHPNQIMANFITNYGYQIYYDGFNVSNIAKNTLLNDIFNTFGIGLKIGNSLDGSMTLTPEDGAYLKMTFVMTHNNDPNMNHYPIEWIKRHMQVHDNPIDIVDDLQQLRDPKDKKIISKTAPEVYNNVQAYKINNKSQKISLEARPHIQQEEKQDIDNNNNQAQKPGGLDFHPLSGGIEQDKWGQLIVYQTNIVSMQNYGHDIGYRLYIIWLDSNKQIQFVSTTDSSSGNLYRTVNKELIWNGTNYSVLNSNEGENGRWMLRFKSKKQTSEYANKYMDSVRKLRHMFRFDMLHCESLAYKYK